MASRNNPLITDEEGFVTRKRRPRRPSGNKNEAAASFSREMLSENLENSPRTSVNHGAKFEESAKVQWNNPSDSDRIGTDGQMKAPPKIEQQETPLEKSKKISPRNEVETSSENGTSLLNFNTNALPKSAKTYELEKFQKNALLIFNQESVSGYNSKRLGTAEDVKQLEMTFSKFGFEVDVKHDLKMDEIMDNLEEFSKKDFTDYGCVAIAVLTHGSNNGLIRAADREYSELRIINHLKIDSRPTLATKPKLLIIQACRGYQDVKGVTVLAPHKGKIEMDRDEEIEPYTLPVESDMLIMHSSYIGKPSYRNELHGSWFIQTLCKKIGELGATQDLESILTEVKREVAIDHSHEKYNKRTLEFDMNKQMPVTTSTLMRKLYFRKFGEGPAVQPCILSLDMPTQASCSHQERSVLDNAPPSTPTLEATEASPESDKFESCSCFLNHYEYMKKSLKMYVDDFPDDAIAASFYKITCTVEDIVAFNKTKHELLLSISTHLRSTNQPEALKYLHYFNKD